MPHVLSAIQTELPVVPVGTDWKQALPIVIVTLIVGVVGGGIIHGLTRNRSCLLRLVAVVVFTLLVVAGLLSALVVAYDLFDGGMLR